MDADVARPTWPPPALWATAHHCLWISGDGEVEAVTAAIARQRAGEDPPIVCHAAATARRLGLRTLTAYDILELFAFVCPAQFCLPTPVGLADHFGLERPVTPADHALLLFAVTETLLHALAEQSTDSATIGIARFLHDSGWPWGLVVLETLGVEPPGKRWPRPADIEIWKQLGEWAEQAPEPAAGRSPVEPMEARRRLAALLGDGAEARPSQADYAAAVTDAFLPRESETTPRMVLAEAGTGVGKTLGYIAPASLWAERNGGAVWISTFTRNLQHQIDHELDRLYPDPVSKSRKVVIRKGRENYLCLLNLEEAINGDTLGLNGRSGAALGLMARWATATRDGDMTGGDFPAWLSDLIGRDYTIGLTDRRGECIYSSCSHYNKCFIEKSSRLARRADIVIANHALVIIQAAIGGLDDAHLPTRYVFDEGHHLFDAADSAFASSLSGSETAELRRWLTGTGGRRPTRARGLESRVGDLLLDHQEGREALAILLDAARTLPADGWLSRISEGHPSGPAELFFDLIYRQVDSRQQDADRGYSVETGTRPPTGGLLAAAEQLEQALTRLATPMLALRDALNQCINDNDSTHEAAAKARIEAISRSLTWRGEMTLGSWRAMLRSLAKDTPPEFVDWFMIERFYGRDIDIGMRRHWLDPTQPLHEWVLRPSHGVIVTSATLRDGSGNIELDWRAAEQRSGAAHLAAPALRVAVASPFDYAKQTRVFIIGDVDRNNPDRVASAYRELFLAAQGGALGLFTAIRRLQDVHERIAQALDEADLPLYAQHVDGLDTATLVEIFKAESRACLLGTDAVRDGVDVPGHSLRLITFDRVPWPRPNILHRARRAAYGGAYNDMLTRLKLKQAFGRLVRRDDDMGVFTLLDPRIPTRLFGAFPPGTPVKRCGLSEAIAETAAFLAPYR